MRPIVGGSGPLNRKMRLQMCVLACLVRGLIGEFGGYAVVSWHIHEQDRREGAGICPGEIPRGHGSPGIWRYYLFSLFDGPVH